MGDSLPYKVKPPVGHKCDGTPHIMFTLYCECGWRTSPNPLRSGAYEDWRQHALKHGGERESYGDHRKREIAHQQKLERARKMGGDAE